MGYLIFCITTAVMATFFLFKPALTRLKISKPNHNLVAYSWISYAVFFMITVLTAPVTFFATIIPNTSLLFQDALFESMNSDLK